jgi:hypothetical protein
MKKRERERKKEEDNIICGKTRTNLFFSCIIFFNKNSCVKHSVYVCECQVVHNNIKKIAILKPK